VSGDDGICRQANLLWGTVPVTVAPNALRHPQALARNIVLELGLGEAGQYILTIAGYTPTAVNTAPAVTALRL
jgi:hypothetical protein